jgi:hypothetical protein
MGISKYVRPETRRRMIVGSSPVSFQVSRPSTPVRVLA